MPILNKEDLSIKEENKDDFTQSVIQRANLTNEFTIGDIIRHIQTLHKMQREADATVDLAKATKSNIEKNHSELIDSLTDKERHHVAMWYQQFQQLEEVVPKQKEIEEELAKHNEYIDIICEEFGFERPNTDPIKHGFVSQEEEDARRAEEEAKKEKDGDKS